MPESDIEVTQTVTYEGNVRLALQQRDSKMGPFIASKGNHTGPKVEVEDVFGQATRQKKTTRTGPWQTSDIDQKRRWLAKPVLDYFHKFIDMDDQLSTKIDIKGPYTMAGAAAVNRARDEAFFTGYYSTAITGKEGTTSVPFKAANVLPVNAGGGGSGLTIEKIMAGREVLGGYHVDLETEKPIIPVTAKQVTDLLKQIEIQSTDYNPKDKTALQQGYVREFLGCIFVPIEFGNVGSFPDAAPLTVDGSGYRRVPMFVPSGVHQGTWLELMAKISQRDDLEGFPWQIVCGTEVAVTRLEEDKCLQLLCEET